MQKTKPVFPILLFILLGLVMAVPAQAQRNERGSGKVVEQDRKLSDFTAISVSSGIDLYLTQGNNYEVVIITDDNIQDNIITKVRGKELHVGVEGSLNQVKQLEVRVTLPTLKALQTSGGSDVYGQNTLRFDDLEIRTSGGSDVELVVMGKTLRVASSGGSDLVLSGEVDMLEASASGGSDIKAKDLVASTCRVAASGGADAWVHAKDKAELSATGASDIHLYGRPALLEQHSSSGADIHRMR